MSGRRTPGAGSPPLMKLDEIYLDADAIGGHDYKV